MEGAWVLPVRMCNRRDAIPPINTDVRYILTVCLPVLNFVFTSDCVSACVKFCFYNIICH